MDADNWKIGDGPCPCPWQPNPGGKWGYASVRYWGGGRRQVLVTYNDKSGLCLEYEGPGNDEQTSVELDIPPFVLRHVVGV